MITPEIIDAMVQSGCTIEQLAAVVKADLAKRENEREIRRAKDREKKRRQRSKPDQENQDVENIEIMSPGQSGTEGDTGDNAFQEEKEKSLIKKEKEESPPLQKKTPLRGSKEKVHPPEIEAEFEILWVAWKPVDIDKGSRKKALESYEKIRKRGIEHEKIIAGSRKYLAFCHETGQRTKHVVTWLNQDGWEFEAPEPTGGKTHPAKQKPAYSDTVLTAAERARMQFRVPDGRGNGYPGEDAGFNGGGNRDGRALPPPGEPGQDHIAPRTLSHAQADGWE